MIVVADTSPLNYFLQIGSETVLPALYQRVLVPSAVLDELAHPDAPTVVGSGFCTFPIGLRSAELPSQTQRSRILILESAKQFNLPKSSERIRY